MRISPAVRSPMTVEQYLAFEKDNPVRHEYVAGEVYAVAGPRLRHNLISSNIMRHLHASARARGCRVYVENVLVRIASDKFYYPDVATICREPELDQWIAENPSLVVEVTSNSTRATDRREKLNHYRTVPSLQHYLIVEQRNREVTAHHRLPDGGWDRLELVDSGRIAIPFLDCVLTLDQIYEDVPMPALRLREGLPDWIYDDDEDDDDEPELGEFH